MCLEHNHDCLGEDFDHFPINRKLSDEEAQSVAFAMNSKAKPAVLVNMVKETFGKTVDNKYLHNIKQKLNKGK